MSSSLFDSLSRGLSVLLAPIVRVVEEPGLLPRLLAELGVPPDANNNALLQSLSAIAELKDRIEALGAQQTPSFESIAAVSMRPPMPSKPCASSSSRARSPHSKAWAANSSICF